MDDIKSISVTVEDHAPGIPASVKVINPTSYKLIGKGIHGAVFLLSPERCVKIYARPQNAQKESKALIALAGFAPKVFEVGPNYVVMEYLRGRDLKDFVKRNRTLPDSFMKQMLSILNEMKRVNFTRIDTELKHFIITKQKEVKIIDLVLSYTSNNPIPNILFRNLDKFGLLDVFLQYVKTNDPSTYLQWEKGRQKPE